MSIGDALNDVLTLCDRKPLSIECYNIENYKTCKLCDGGFCIILTFIEDKLLTVNFKGELIGEQLYGDSFVIILEDCKVQEYVDGDTMRVANQSGIYKIRLYGIDCPELDQKYGDTARVCLTSTTLNRNLSLFCTGQDRYDRLLCILMSDNMIINKYLLKHGLAWVYDQHCNMEFCKNWYHLQQTSESRRLGLWAELNPTPPWIHRQRNR